MILAGGLSRRYGTDKCFADWNGTPFLRRVSDALLAACDQLLILGRTDATAARYHEVVPEARVKLDVQSQAGPVAALRSARAEFRKEWIFVAPCDAPGLTPTHVEELFSQARAAKDVAVAAVPDGVLYDLFCTPRHVLESRLETARRLEDLVADARRVEFPADAGLNVNEPSPNA